MLNDRKNSFFGSAILMVCALIWGFAFVPQMKATNTINFVAFNCLRFVQAAMVLVVFLFVYELVARKWKIPVTRWNMSAVLGGVLGGICLFIATDLQQYGIAYTTVGKASFITAMYIVFVPLLGLLVGRRPHMICWYAILIAFSGFFLLCVDDDLSIGIGDAYILLCAVLLSLQIAFVDLFCQDADPIKLTLIQFLTCAVLGVPAMAVVGFPCPAEISESALSLLYLGVMSAGVGFTLQTIGQKHTDPSVATLIMSLEAIVGIICGIIFLHEQPSFKELGGCLLVFIGVFLAQMTFPKTMLVFRKEDFAITQSSPYRFLRK